MVGLALLCVLLDGVEENAGGDESDEEGAEAAEQNGLHHLLPLALHLHKRLTQDARTPPGVLGVWCRQPREVKVEGQALGFVGERVNLMAPQSDGDSFEDRLIVRLYLD